MLDARQLLVLYLDKKSPKLTWDQWHRDFGHIFVRTPFKCFLSGMALDVGSSLPQGDFFVRTLCKNRSVVVNACWDRTRINYVVILLVPAKASLPKKIYGQFDFGRIEQFINNKLFCIFLNNFNPSKIHLWQRKVKSKGQTALFAGCRGFLPFVHQHHVEMKIPSCTPWSCHCL